MGIVCTYLGALLFYAADAIQKRSSAGMSVWRYLFVRSLYTTASAGVATRLLCGDATYPSLAVLGELLLDALVCALGLACYIRSVGVLQLSNVGALGVIGTAMQQIYAYVFTGEKPTPWRIIACLVMSFGSLVQLATVRFQRGTLYVVGSSFFWTLGYILLSRTLQKTSFIWSVPMLELGVLVLSGVVLLWARVTSGAWPLGQAVQGPTMVLLGGVICAASFANNYGFQRVPIGTISFLQLSMMPIVFVLSLRLFRERPARIELVSFFASVVGFGLFIASTR